MNQILGFRISELLSKNGMSQRELAEKVGVTEVTEPQTGMNRYVIYFNDSIANTGRLRWNIFHEIGHIYLGHHDHPDDSRYKIEEAEADFFAKYAIAPPPLVNEARCKNPDDIVAIFESSHDAARYVFEYYKKWLQFGPRDYLPFEKNLLRLFHLTAA